jgi:outer membrane protein TolC
MIVVAVMVSAAHAHAQPLTIDEAIDRALSVSEDARAANARKRQAEAGVSAVRSAFLPTVTLNGSYTRRGHVRTGGTSSQRHDALAADVTAAMTLFDGRNYPLLRAARRRLDAAALDEQEQRRQIAYSTAAAYLVALGQQGVVEAALRREELATARRRDIGARVEAKLVSTNDRTQADLELATATRELANARAALDVAYHDLGWWIGGTVTGPLVSPAPLLTQATDSSGPAAVTENRPDLAAARLRIDEARETAAEPSRRWWPTLDLTGRYLVSNETFTDQRNTDWSVVLGATWVLWDGGRRSADRRIAELDVELARLEADAASRRASTELSTAAAQLRGARAALPPAEQTAAAAAANADEIGVLYAQGLARALDVTDAGAKRFEAEVALVQARLDVAAAWLALTHAAGTGPLADGAKP